MSIKFILEKFGVELEPNAFLTRLELTRVWNENDQTFVVGLVAVFSVYSSTDKAELIEEKNIILHKIEGYEVLVDTLLKETYKFTTGLFEEGETDEVRKAPTKKPEPKPEPEEPGEDAGQAEPAGK